MCIGLKGVKVNGDRGVRDRSMGVKDLRDVGGVVVLGVNV